MKILFRIPLSIYWLCWNEDFKKFCLATKQLNAGTGYYFKQLI